MRFHWSFDPNVVAYSCHAGSTSWTQLDPNSARSNMMTIWRVFEIYIFFPKKAWKSLKKLNYEGKRTNVSSEYLFWLLLAICYSGDIATSIYRLIFMSDINCSLFSYIRTWDCTQFYFFVWLSVFWSRIFAQSYVILWLSLKKLMSLSWKLTCKLVECQNANEDGAGSPCYLEDENGDMDLNRPQVCKIIHFRLTSFHLTRNCWRIRDTKILFCLSHQQRALLNAKQLQVFTRCGSNVWGLEHSEQAMFHKVESI